MADLRRKNGREEPWRVKYWGVGNENWGCGGRMRPEYYADLYRRYQTYLRNFSGNDLFKIACGAPGPRYRWTEVVMREAAETMDGLSLHYYTRLRRHPADRGSATEFGEAEWFAILQKALFMEELVSKHSTIMDRYDPDKRVGLMVDEWGTWYQVEPGTTPGFLYQQNSLRDALVAGITLNILNNHCDRVRMANIAQTVNVLQAMVLTKGEKMVLTPTYHVFEMYKVHQDATLVPVSLTCGDYRFGDDQIPALSVSASRDPDGRVHVSLCNLDPNEQGDVVCHLRGAEFSKVTGRILTAERINAHNTFDQPEQVKPTEFGAVKLEGTELTATLPPKAVVVLEIE